jgi:GNAT superfamily N-acetyltransferase
MTEHYRIISLRNNPDWLDRFADYFSSKWPVSREVYHDSMSHSIDTPNPLPRWYVMLNNSDDIVGCFGLIANDFNSRQDLWPWLCALYIEESERGQSLGGKLLVHGVAETKRLGFEKLYLVTDHIGYYEKYGFAYSGQCYGNDGEAGRIYECPC